MNDVNSNNLQKIGNHQFSLNESNGSIQLISSIMPSFNDSYNFSEILLDDRDKNFDVLPIPVAATPAPQVIFYTAIDENRVINNGADDLNGELKNKEDGQLCDDNKYRLDYWPPIKPIVGMGEYLTTLSTADSCSRYHFVKFSSDSTAIKQQLSPNDSTLSTDVDSSAKQEEGGSVRHHQVKSSRKRSSKKEPAAKKIVKLKPGQIRIATALDGTRLFCCPECNAACFQVDILQQHLVTHGIERKFICEICGVGLKRREHLDRHRLGHSSLRPFACTVCSKSFKRKEHLKLHNVLHSDSKSEVCGECGKSFYRRDHLKKHSKIHLPKEIRSQQRKPQATKQTQQSNEQQPQQQFRQHHQQPSFRQHHQQPSQHHTIQQQNSYAQTLILATPTFLLQDSATQSPTIIRVFPENSEIVPVNYDHQRHLTIS